MTVRTKKMVKKGKMLLEDDEMVVKKKEFNEMKKKDKRPREACGRIRKG